MVVKIVLTIACSLIVGYLFQRAKIPGGMLIGSVVGSAVLSIVFQMAYMPTGAKVLAQSMAGAFIGCSVNKNNLKEMKQLFRPALIVLSIHLVLNISVGFVIYAISPLDLLTSLMSAVPGGLSDVPLIAADMGADSPKVLALQFVRMLVGIGIFPTLINRVTANEVQPGEAELAEEIRKKSAENHSKGETALTIVVALVFGTIGKLLGVPAGTLLFSLIAVMLLKIIFNKAYLPLLGKRLAQLLSGAYIGSSMHYQDVIELRYLIVPAVILVAGYSISCFLIGHLLKKHCGMTQRKGMITAIPAGASDMALIASDMGVQSADLIILQIIRLLVVVSIFPQIIALIVKIVG